ncbi:MAG: hypothetical protein ABI740_01860 [Alphaproteobacteria bacterium]
MSKYEPLTSFLNRAKKSVVELSFSEIEGIIGAKLPASAYEYPAFWSNNAEGHVNARAWIAAGFLSERVDIAAERIVFRRSDATVDGASNKATGEELLAAVYGCMRGTVYIPEGIDIMEPVELEWDAMKD